MEIEVENWTKLSKLIEETASNPTERWLFRGVTNLNEHTLIPKIGREKSRRNPIDGKLLPYSDTEEEKLLKNFKRTARPFIQFEPEYDIEWLAVAQHYGAPTRLLDWTESALVAAYFALERSGTEKSPPAIYAIKAPPMLPSQDHHPIYMGGDIKDVRTYVPPHISPRIQVQRSVFTIHPNPEKEYKPKELQTWILPTGRASFVLRLIIDQLGYNRASLFPDLQGLAEYTGWAYKWGRLWEIKD